MRNNAADREKIRTAVTETLQVLLRDQAPIDENTDPINDLGLESVDGILLAPRVGERLGFRIPDRENLLVDSQRGKTRKVGEIIDVLMNLSKAAREARNA